MPFNWRNDVISISNTQQNSLQAAYKKLHKKILAKYQTHDITKLQSEARSRFHAELREEWVKHRDNELANK